MTGPAASLPSPVGWIQFDGPLNFLLDEVRRQEVEIERIEMAPLVARYLEYVRGARDRNLNLDIEWLHTASQLILWKSRALLPHDPAAASPPDPVRDELVDQLRRYREQMAAELGTRLRAEQSRMVPGSVGGFKPDEEREEGEEDLPFVSAWDLIGQARDLARWCLRYRENLRAWRETLEVEQETVTVEEMTDWLRLRLGEARPGEEVEGTALLAEQESAGRRCCLFLGMLELVRGGEIGVCQPEAWGEIWITVSVRAH